MSANSSRKPFEDQFNAIIEQYQALVQRFLAFGHLPNTFNTLIENATKIRDPASFMKALEDLRPSFLNLDLTANPTQVVKDLLGTATGGADRLKGFADLPKHLDKFTATIRSLSDRNAQMMYSIIGNVIIPINSALAALERLGLPVTAMVRSVKSATETVDIVTPAMAMITGSLERFLTEAEKYFKAATGVELQQSEEFVAMLKEFQDVVMKMMALFRSVGEPKGTNL